MSKRGKKSKREDKEQQTRIAIVNKDKCKPKKCDRECYKSCPVVRMGKKCIEVTKKSKKAFLSEILCIGCGICVKKCPFGAINIINLPGDLESRTTHRYGPNSFKLHGLPMPRADEVLGLVGINGIGKSTALKVLAGKLKPNLGNFEEPPEWTEILRYFRGNELQNYFTKILEEEIRAVVKPQYVDQIPRAVSGKIGKILKKKDEMKNVEEIAYDLDLVKIWRRKVDQLSGGELQRFAIAATCIQQADVYMFDEPSSYLDVKQRLEAGKVIRGLLRADVYVVVVEHDLSVLDYLSDKVCCIYGTPQAYGVVTLPFNVRDGINVFLSGFVPTENLRFRQEEISFKVAAVIDNDENERFRNYAYPAMSKTLEDFALHVQPGSFTNSEIIVLLGQNGCGKTTFIRLLAGIIDADEEKESLGLSISYKPQKIAPKFEGSVRSLLHKKIRSMYQNPRFVDSVMKPLNIEPLMNETVTHLSGGELQRVALTLCLGQPADIYLIDEPSAYLDCEQRIIVSKIIKRFILHEKKTAFVVEHDFIMATYLADRVVVYEGEPARDCTATTPQGLLSGMNQFLEDLEVTFRRDPTNYRPRINKLDSQKDKDQKAEGNYFFMDDEA